MEGTCEQNEYRKNPKKNCVISQKDKDQLAVQRRYESKVRL